MLDKDVKDEYLYQVWLRDATLRMLTPVLSKVGALLVQLSKDGRR